MLFGKRRWEGGFDPRRPCQPFLMKRKKFCRRSRRVPRVYPARVRFVPVFDPGRDRSRDSVAVFDFTT
jgi:hypothetical protein